MELIEQLKAAKVIAIVRGDYTLEAIRIMARTLHETNVNVLEVTMNSPRALEVIRMLQTEFGDQMLIGAGTVTDPAQVQQIADVGGRFVVAPETYEPVIKMALGLGLEPIPGAFTPTEVMTAHRAGANLIKLFPASLGGTDYLKAIQAPLDHINFVATGGIEIAQVRSYIDAGAIAVGMGSSLIPKHFEATPEDVKVLRERGHRLMQTLSGSKVNSLLA